MIWRNRTLVVAVSTDCAPGLYIYYSGFLSEQVLIMALDFQFLSALSPAYVRPAMFLLKTKGTRTGDVF